MRRATVAAVAVLVAVIGLSDAPASAEQAVGGEPDAVAYAPPVDAELTDTFRPPANPYGAGNRGVDYATAHGQPVHAAAPGEVVFAGRVGLSVHVVVLHQDGIRTSYSFLRSTAVHRGQRVRRGDVVGTAAASGLHFGARAGDAYVDPLVLFGQPTGRVHLVADPDRDRPLAEVEERRRLIESLRGLPRRAIGGIRGVADRAMKSARARTELVDGLLRDLAAVGMPLPLQVALAAMQWDDAQPGCTPAGTPVPSPPPERRIVVLVGGLGSETGDAAVLGVDTTALGYRPGDVHQFSYRADRAGYGRRDTEGDIRMAADSLRRHVSALRAAHPGVPIDVIGHSLGGLVARTLVSEGEPVDVATVVTLGTPHQGADLATGTDAIASSTSGKVVLEMASRLRVGGLDPKAVSITQMVEGSPLLRELEQQQWPPSTRVVSIAAQRDPIVPNPQSELRGADNVVVSLDGWQGLTDHTRLPASPQATDEILRTLAGQRPTCRSFGQWFLDRSIGLNLSAIEDVAGVTLAVGGHWVDAQVKAVLVAKKAALFATR